MISRITQLACGLLFVVFALSAHSQLKIAMVQAQKAIIETEEAKVELEAIEAELLPEQNRLRAIQDEILSLRDKATKDADIMSADELSDVQKQIENKQLDLNYGAERLNKQLNDEREKLFQKLAPRFNAVLNDLIDIEGYDIVYNFNPQVHLYVNPKHDVTRKVTEMLNDRSGTEVVDSDTALSP